MGRMGGRPGEPSHACSLCAGTAEEARRRRMIQLLALLEHPDALPRDLALRLGGELLRLTDGGPTFQCEAVP
ncbi:MAG: hypothetical protein K0R27_4271 [Xanthobacteraceae bacterium]|jgi:hypothetical protein|nr:hypothetical protein [Xanthobacteraceae bacterium]